MISDSIIRGCLNAEVRKLFMKNKTQRRGGINQ